MRTQLPPLTLAPAPRLPARTATNGESMRGVDSSPEAHQASLQLSAVQQLISQARPVLAAMGERFEFQPVGGKGLHPPLSI
jgi:hypothetical protein